MTEVNNKMFLKYTRSEKNNNFKIYCIRKKKRKHLCTISERKKNNF